MSGVIALIGGGEWTEGCSFDRELLAASGAAEVVVLPTAAAYEHPQRGVERATTYLGGLGASVRGLPVLLRQDAEDDDHADVVRNSRFVYIGGGSPLHLRSVLKESKLWYALLHAWQSGAVVAGSSAGAMVLTDPMVDPRGGALTVGLGLVEQLAVVPNVDRWSPDKTRRAIELAPHDIPVVGIPERTALIRESDGTWRVSGAGDIRVFVNGQPAGLEALPG